jgi:hypothetical protein
MNRPARHNQTSNETHKAARVKFCRRIFGMRELLKKIHFADESRIVFGDDKRRM